MPAAWISDVRPFRTVPPGEGAGARASRLDRALLLCVAAPLLVLLPLPVGLEGSKVFFTEAVLCLLGLVACLEEAVRPRAALPRAVAVPALLTLLLAAAALAWTPYLHAGLARLAFWTSLLGVVLLLARVRDPGFLRSLALLSVLVAFGFASASLFQYAGLLPRDHWAGPLRLAGPFNNSNLFGAYVMIHLIVALGLAADAGALRARAALIAASLPLAAALVLTVSRGAWIASAAGVSILSFLLLRRPGGLRSSWRWAALALLFGGVLLAVIVGLHGLKPIAARLEGAGTYSLGQRLSIWKDTGALILRRPWGLGPGMYAHAFPSFRTFASRFVVNFAHSDPLEHAAELGVAGLALGVLLAAGVLKGLAAVDAGRRRGLRAGLIAGASALLLFSAYDFPLHKPAVSYSFLWMACAGLGLPGASGAAPRVRLSRGGLSVFALSLTAALAFAGLNLQASRLGSEGKKLASAARLLPAMAAYGRAHALSLGNFEHARSAADAAMQRAALPIEQRKYLETARGLYEAAARDNPLDAAARLGIAVACDMLADAGEAEASYRKAAALDPMYGPYNEYLGFFLVRQGRIEEGVSAYVAGNRFGLERAVLPDRFFQAVPEEPDARLRAVSALAAASALKQYPETLRKLVSKLPGPEAALEMAERVEEAGGTEALVIYLEAAGRRFPRSEAVRDRLRDLKSAPGR